MSDAWPPHLKAWVAKCLGQMTDVNRKEAQEELRQVIAESFANKSLWTTDWDGVQLQSLLPKPQPVLKRKSDDKPTTNKKKKNNAKVSVTTQSSQSRHHDLNDKVMLNKRAERFQREHEIERQKMARSGSGSLLQVNSSHNNLFNRIHSRSASPSMWNNDAESSDSNVMDWDRYTIIGTSESVFKDYLRLTSEPDPRDIRPYRILKETLVKLKQKWKEDNDYPWICNQFKSIRQDLTVQRIKNEFTVQVYEIHARMAMEAGDMVEYNQCQSMLKSLYELGIQGCVDEFMAYRILMLLHGMNRSDINLLVGQLTSKQKSSPSIKHALEVQRALSANNYHTFFDLYLHAPNMGAYIMDHFVDRERTRALMIMTKAYQRLPVKFLQEELAFDSARQTCEFLNTHRAAFYQNPNAPGSQKVIECKPCQVPLSQVFEEKYRKATIKGAI